MTAAARILSPPGTFVERLELICRDAREVDLGDDRARYSVGRSDFQRLLLWARRQWECCRYREQWVAAIEAERMILIETIHLHDHAGREFETQTRALEIWMDEDGYEDRLDELAGVAVAA